LRLGGLPLCALRLSARRPGDLRLGGLPPRPGGLLLSAAAHFAAACPATLRFAARHPHLSALRLCSGRLSSLRLNAMRLGGLRIGGLRLGALRLNVLRPRTPAARRLAARHLRLCTGCAPCG